LRVTGIVLASALVVAAITRDLRTTLIAAVVLLVGALVIDFAVWGAGHRDN
jgi:hypothetical protein